MDFSRPSHKNNRETTTSYNVNLTFDMRTSNISNAPVNHPNFAIESQEGISEPSNINVDHNCKQCDNRPLNNRSDLNRRNNTANIANDANVTTSAHDVRNVTLINKDSANVSLDNMNRPCELSDLNRPLNNRSDLNGRNITANIANDVNVTTSAHDVRNVTLINQDSANVSLDNMNRKNMNQPSEFSDNGNGKPQGNRHGSIHNIRHGYSNGINLAIGKPSGNSQASDDTIGIQSMRSSDQYSGEEANRNSLQAQCKPQGNSTVPGKPSFAEPTLVPGSSIGFVPPPWLVIIRENPKYSEIIQACYPNTRSNYEEVSRYERMAIDMLVNANIPFLNYGERRMFRRQIGVVNSYRSRNGIEQIPLGLEEQKIKVLVPEYEELVARPYSNVPEELIEQFQKYKEGLRLAMVECEVIDWISKGVIPKMGDQEKIQLEEDLEKINLDREIDLDLSKSFIDHFKTLRIPGSSSGSDSSTDSDSNHNPNPNSSGSDISTDSDSLSDTSTVFDEPAQAREENFLENHLAFRALVDLTDDKDDEKDTPMVEVTDGNSPSSTSVKDSPQLMLNKNVVTFIETLLTMTLCPINHTMFKEPFAGPDRQTYEKEAIERWLTNHNTSPMSRSPLYLEDMREDVTMTKLIAALDSHHVGEDMLSDIAATKDTLIEDTKPSPTQDTLCTENNDNVMEDVSQDVNQENLERRQKKRKKVQKQKRNRASKQRELNVLNRHIQYLKDQGWYEERNLREDLPTMPSFSIMHSLSTGFSIVLYSCTHRVKLRPELPIHCKNAIRLILPQWMMLIWHENLYHSGAKSRSDRNGNHIDDMRFFSYVWPELATSVGNRNRGLNDGVAREEGDLVYRENLSYHTCQHLWDESPPCQLCQQDETVIDLSNIPPRSYLAGERIFGDLKELGWLVVRGVRVDEPTYHAINEEARRGRAANGKWNPIEDNGNNRKMKYKHTSVFNNQWLEGKRKEFIDGVTDVLNTIMQNRDNNIYEHYHNPSVAINPPKYVVEKFNLIKNDGRIYDDQILHRDFAPRAMQ